MGRPLLLARLLGYPPSLTLLPLLDSRRKVLLRLRGSLLGHRWRSRLLVNTVCGFRLIVVVSNIHRFDFSAESRPPAADQQLKLLVRCIRCILTRDPGPADILPATYEAIYTACQTIVTVSLQGEDLYNNVKMELEKSITQLSRSLSLSTEKDTAWIVTFNKALAWFEQQIVRTFYNIIQCTGSLIFIQVILKSLLTYLDQFYVAQERNVMNVQSVIHSLKPKPVPYPQFSDLAYFLVSEHIFGSARIAENLRTGVKGWLEWERVTRSVDVENLENVADESSGKSTPTVPSSQPWSTTFFDTTNIPRLRNITLTSRRHSTSTKLPDRRRPSKTTRMHSSTALVPVSRKKQPGRRRLYPFQHGAP